MIENYTRYLIEKLKQNRQITPTEPVLLAAEPTTCADHTISSYLTDIMSQIPKRIGLQEKIIAMFIQELSTTP